jgi:DNA-binding NarL/FixJ family response regulator
MTGISVLVADDQSLIRGAVRQLLDYEPDITVVGEAVNGREAVAIAGAEHPDVILMDIRMPVMDGLEATRRICSNPDTAATRVLIFTTFEEDEYVAEALRAGASGFIGKGAEPSELATAIRTIHAGESLLSPRATRALIDRYLSTPARAKNSRVDLSELTDREQEVLTLVAAGHPNDHIAALLTISPSTAKTHVNRIMTKLRAHDRAQLVIIAYEAGLITPGTAPL